MSTVFTIPVTRYFKSQIFLGAAVLLAWLPLVHPASPVSDDFTYLDDLQKLGPLGYFRTYGFWRPLGATLPMLVWQVNSTLPHVLSILTHLATVLVFYDVLVRLLGGFRLPLICALFFACVPLGSGALTWMCTYNYIVPVLCFWLLWRVLCLHRVRPAAGAPLVARCIYCALLVFLMQLGNETLFFSTFILLLFLWIDESRLPGIDTIKRHGRLALSLSMAWSATLWLLLLQHASDSPKMVHVHLNTLLSFWVRQYTLLDVFYGWLSPAARSLVFYGCHPLTFVLIAAATIIMVLTLRRLENGVHLATDSVPPARKILILTILLIIGASFVYVMGGGFSPDSRKKYPALPLFILLVGACFRLIPPPQWLNRRWKAVIGIIILVGCPTTWMAVGVWNHQLDLHTAAMAAAAAHAPHGSANEVKIIWNPDLYQEWPQLAGTSPFRMDDYWIVDLALKYEYHIRIKDKSAPPIVLRQIPHQVKFEIVP